ncbi:MAG: RNA 2',3'-cyclic phosphodiesterase [Clostridia bacterium]|nr:RNA 2',3'-cyclic phosphodiesterase [Clostridia bacterium]
MRLFVAVKLNKEAKRHNSDVQEDFLRQRVLGNYTPPEKMHITLAFIGEYRNPDSVLDALETVMFRPFSVTTVKVGCFGDLWWTGFEYSRELDELAGRVRRALAESDIPYDGKKFRPHVTILRNAVYPREGFSNIYVEPFTVPVDGFFLMRSDRGKTGMIYTELGYIPARK